MKNPETQNPKGGKKYKGNKITHTLSTDDGVTKAQAVYGTILSQKTGLSLKVVATWMFLENGPDDNILNIGPGYHYDSVSAGAEAAAKLLHTAPYKGVMASVGKSDLAQIHAIAESPWCPKTACPGYEQQLISIYNTRTKGIFSGPASGGKSLLDEAGNIISGAADAITSNPITDIVKLMSRLFEPDFWLRVGKVVLGILIIAVALVLFVKVSTDTVKQTAIRKFA